ncbi:MAG TPA: tetratricopeptide repeat protein [Alphaproteobacteria bacterium]
MKKLVISALAALWFVAAGHPASADQTDGRLDKLFADLKATSDPVEGQAITESIWQIWYETDNTKAEALLNEGVDAMDNDRYDAALEDFNRLVETAPDFAEGWNRRATLLYMMGEFDGSVRDIERTLELEPRHFGALSGLGLIYVQIGNEEAALKAFKQAFEINPHLEGVKANIESIEKSMSDKGI